MKSYFLAQSINEINYILKKFNQKDITCVPLNLEQYLYCKKNNINFIDVKFFLNNDVHKKCLLKSDEIIKSLEFINTDKQNIKYEFIGILRVRINLLVFILELLNKVNRKEKIENIIFSGWVSKNPTDTNCYFLHNFQSILENRYNIISLNKKIVDEQKSISDFKFILKGNVNNKVINILLNNGGYNFKRFFLNNLSRKYTYYFFTSKKIKFLKRIILSFFNSYPIYFKKIKSKKKKFIKINFRFKTRKNKEIQTCIIKIMKGYNYYFNNLLNFQNRVLNFLSKYNFSLIISNICKGLEGSLIYEGERKKLNTLCVSHGTIAKHFNKYDQIYKKTIAEAVFSGKSTYFALQSKIFNDSLATHKIDGAAINSGNLIFAEKKFNIFKKKKYILYAVTLKNLDNFQVYGVELFYEFYDNLENLNKLAKDNGLNILVNIHPSHSHLKKSLQENFNELFFKSEKIENLLNNSYVVISFSSTVIEDSLNSKIPVILFDPWKRYQHCEIKTKGSQTSCLYYVNDYKNLIKYLHKLKKENFKIINDFKKYVYLKKSNYNIKNILKLILEKK